MKKWISLITALCMAACLFTGCGAKQETPAPAAIVKTSQNADAAQAFLDYLVSDAGDVVFEAVGFTPVA